MIRLTLTQMRLNAGRLNAAGIAVVLGTAFVAATLLSGELLKTTMYQAVSASYRGADVVVTKADVPASMLTTVRRLPQLDGADASDATTVELMAGPRSDVPSVASLPTTPALRTTRATSGRLPSDGGEIALSADLAARLWLAVGDRATVRTQSWPEEGDRPVPHEAAVTVVGILAPATGFGLSPDAVADPDDVRRWLREQGDAGRISRIVAHAAPGVSPETARDAVAALPGWGGAVIRTGEQQTLADTRELTRDVDVMAAGLLAFAAVALFVAGLVITNTFQVLVAQRTRMLALLRCTGATRKQIRRSVLFEAVVLGSATSLAGLITGTALVNAAAAVLSRMDLQVDVPGAVAPSLASVLVPLVVGVVVTVLAALSPARAATRVSPVAALRPAPTSSLRARACVVRLVLVLLMVAAGAALLALGVAMTSREKDASGLVPALAGGALSFLGVLVGGSVFLPRLVGLTGRLAGRWGGVPTRIATANAVRNPRRTATTSAALLIGVTLVATMSTGAAVLTATLNRELDSHFPVDVMVGFEPYGPAVDAAPPATPVPAAVAPAAARVDGVADSALLNGGQVRLSGWSGQPRTATTASDPEYDPDAAARASAIQAAGTAWVTVQAIDPARATATLRNRSGTAGLAPGSVVVPSRIAGLVGVRGGDALTLAADGRSAQLRAVVTDLSWDALLVTPADLRTVLPKASPGVLWLRLDPAADARTTVRDLQEAVVSATGSQLSVPVAGLAVERAVYEQVIHTLLLIFTGLLGVAVVIAGIGVANTLSLSVIERTRESAVLRALGLTRRQLRVMLAVEGTLIAGIGAVVGIGLGVVFGWAGAASVIGGVYHPALVLPVGELALLLAGGVLAGLVASALPGRRAARTAPVAALAE